MASRIDVIMAQYDRDTSEEERAMQERIEKSKTIRALDDITAMAETAEMGYNIGTTVSDLSKSFKLRRGMKKSFIKEYGKEAWKRGGPGGSQSGRNRRRHFLKNNNMVVGQDLTQDKLISMYMQGTNITTTTITPNGQVITSDDKNKQLVNVQSYGINQGPKSGSFKPGIGSLGSSGSGTSTTNPSGTYTSKNLTPDPDTKNQPTYTSILGGDDVQHYQDGTEVLDPNKGKGWGGVRERGPEADWWLGKNIDESGGLWNHLMNNIKFGGYSDPEE